MKEEKKRKEEEERVAEIRRKERAGEWFVWSPMSFQGNGWIGAKSRRFSGGANKNVSATAHDKTTIGSKLKVRGIWGFPRDLRSLSNIVIRDSSGDGPAHLLVFVFLIASYCKSCTVLMFSLLIFYPNLSSPSPMLMWGLLFLFFSQKKVPFISSPPRRNFSNERKRQRKPNPQPLQSSCHPQLLNRKRRKQLVLEVLMDGNWQWRIKDVDKWQWRSKDVDKWQWRSQDVDKYHLNKWYS